MGSIQRTLHFFYHPYKIMKDVNVIFTFQPPTSRALTDVQNRVAWKVFRLKKGDRMGGKFSIDYKGDFGFSTAQLPGQSTTLNPNGFWSPPTFFAGGDFQAINKTDTYQNIAVGPVIYKGDYPDLLPTFVFRVGLETEGSLMTTDISTALYWTQDLSVLPGLIEEDSLFRNSVVKSWVESWVDSQLLAASL
ncbi:hypothetical protein L218DRAFT_949112 [Marasmius fiardii PR-910]|nr:hypothetical protein L218DRAFT_949112 [Marasmius fiardii PR-910]